LKIVHNDFKTVNLGYTNNKLIILDLDAMQRYNSKYYNNQKDITRLKKCFTDNSVLIELFEQYINK